MMEPVPLSKSLFFLLWPATMPVEEFWLVGSRTGWPSLSVVSSEAGFGLVMVN